MMKVNVQRTAASGAAWLAIALLAGCASPRRVAPSASAGKPMEPKPLELVELPDYGTEKTGYDTSAGCFILSRFETEDAVTRQLRIEMARALRERGYVVVELESDNTAEQRGRVRKLIALDLYACRTQYLPTKNQTAADMALVVSVMDRPDTVPTKGVEAAVFHVMGREVTGQLDESLGGLTTPGAVEQVVANLFRIDAFRKVLEGEGGAVAQN